MAEFTRQNDARHGGDPLMKQIKLYTRGICGWCLDAKEYLTRRGIAFQEIDVGRDPGANAEMKSLSGQSYVPTITVDGHVLANFDVDQLEAFLKSIDEPAAPPPK